MDRAIDDPNPDRATEYGVGDGMRSAWPNSSVAMTLTLRTMSLR